MLRYWDGSAWTQQVRQAGESIGAGAASAPMSDFTGYDRYAQRDASYVPFGRGQSSAPSGLRMVRGSASTFAIWMFALVPLLAVIHRYVPWTFDADDFTYLAIHGVVIFFTVVFALLLAAVDRSQLRASGYTSTPPAVVGLVPPVHMLLRLFTTGPGSIPVTIFALLVQAGVVASFVLLSPAAATPPAAQQAPSVDAGVNPAMEPPFSENQVAYLLTPAGMAEKIVYDARTGPLVFDSVTCEPLPTTDFGAQTTCRASGEVADYLLQVQAIDNGGVPFTVISTTADFR